MKFRGKKDDHRLVQIRPNTCTTREVHLAEKLRGKALFGGFEVIAPNYPVNDKAI